MPPLRCAVATLVVALTVAACDTEGDPDAGMDAGRDAGGVGRAPCSLDAGARDAGVAMGLPRRCAEALLLTGLGLRFDEGAAPLSRFAVFPRTSEPEPFTCPSTAVHHGASIVADLRAPGTVSVTYQVVGAGELGVLDAGTSVGLPTARGSATIELDSVSEGTAIDLIDLTAAGLVDAPHLAVVLDGLEVDTDVPQGLEYPSDYDPRDGYTLRGLGASVVSFERRGDDLATTLGALFALGRSDDPAMNRALPVARVTVVVHYLVVGLPSAPVTGEVRYREQHRGHGAGELEVCRPEAAITRVELEGEALPGAAAGLTQFALRLFPDDAPEGDRVRELSVRIADFEWDASTRRASMHVEGYASNAGPPEPRRPMDYELEASVALLQWSGAGSTESLRFEAPIEAGRNELPLPLAH